MNSRIAELTEKKNSILSLLKEKAAELTELVGTITSEITNNNNIIKEISAENFGLTTLKSSVNSSLSQLNKIIK